MSDNTWQPIETVPDGKRRPENKRPMLLQKYREAFAALTHIAGGTMDPKGYARAAMQRCVDLGDDSEAPRPLEAALRSARDELVRQRAIWTGSKNDSWAIAAIDTEMRRIDDALKA